MTSFYLLNPKTGEIVPAETIPRELHQDFLQLSDHERSRRVKQTLKRRISWARQQQLQKESPTPEEQDPVTP